MGLTMSDGRSMKEDVRRKMYENVVAQMCSTSAVRGLTIFAKNSGTKIRSVHYFFCTFVLPKRLVANG